MWSLQVGPRFRQLRHLNLVKLGHTGHPDPLPMQVRATPYDALYQPY